MLQKGVWPRPWELFWGIPFPSLRETSCFCCQPPLLILYGPDLGLSWRGSHYPCAGFRLAFRSVRDQCKAEETLHHTV